MPLLLFALACAPPTTDAYAIGVANLVGRTLRDAAPRVFEGADDPERSWEEAMRFEGSVESPQGLPSLRAPWAGAFDVSLTQGDSGDWDFALEGEDVRVRRFDDVGCWDVSCSDPADSLHGGCAIDWDPANYAFSLAFQGTVQLPWGPPPEREDVPTDDEAERAREEWYSDPSVAIAVRAEGLVDGQPAVVVAGYGETEYGSELGVEVTIHDETAPHVVCGSMD
jgi:hypothetical protein